MSPVLSPLSLSHTLVDLSEAAKRFLEEFGDSTELEGESLAFPYDCLRHTYDFQFR